MGPRLELDELGVTDLPCNASQDGPGGLTREEDGFGMFWMAFQLLYTFFFNGYIQLWHAMAMVHMVYHGLSNQRSSRVCLGQSPTKSSEVGSLNLSALRSAEAGRLARTCAKHSSLAAEVAGARLFRL